MKGETVKISPRVKLPDGWEPGLTGVVIAESDNCVGIKVEGKPVPLIVRKVHVAVLT